MFPGYLPSLPIVAKSYLCPHSGHVVTLLTENESFYFLFKSKHWHFLDRFYTVLSFQHCKKFLYLRKS